MNHTIRQHKTLTHSELQRGPAYDPQEDDGYESGPAWCAALGWSCVGIIVAWLVLA